MSNNSSIRKSIYPWFETVANFYLSDINQDDDENEAAMTAFLEHAMSLLQNYMKRKPEVAKKQWQNLPLAAALASFKLLHLEVDVSELWKQCQDKCDESIVKSIEQEMLLSENSSVDEAEKKVVPLAEPEKKAVAPPSPSPSAIMPKKDNPTPASSSAAPTPKKGPTPASSSAAPTPKKGPTPASSGAAPTPKKNPTPAPTPKQLPTEEKKKKEEEEDKDKESTDEDDEESDSEPDTLSEVEDDDVELSKYRRALQIEPISNAYVRFVYEDSMTRVWPFATGVDVTFNTLECVGRIFRLYVLKLKPSKTKEEVHNASAGALLAVLDHMGDLPKKSTDASLVTDLYDALPMTSKRGILSVWQDIKSKPDLLKTKCRVGRAGKPEQP
jgi:hypothetical protein